MGIGRLGGGPQLGTLKGPGSWGAGAFSLLRGAASLQSVLLGVDVGGTFTDAVLFDGRELHTAKAPTTPDDQSRGVLAAIDAALGARRRRARARSRPSPTG